MAARRRGAIAGAVVTAMLLTVLATLGYAEAASSKGTATHLTSPSTSRDAVSERPRGVVADCSKGSGVPQGSLSVFRSRGNLVVGPLAMSGAARVPAFYSPEFGGNKFPLFVRAGHRVTLALTPDTRGQAALAYGPLPPGTVKVREANRVITFIACRRGQFSPGLGAKAGRLSFWAGGVVARGPRCVPLLIWVDDEPSPRRAVIHLGVRDCAAPAAEQPVLCTADEVETVARRFISSFNAGALGELDDLFAQEPEFEWYSTDAPGERFTPAANDRASLVSYFRDRHAVSERLELGSFTFNGNTQGSRAYGNFQYTLTRRAEDLSPTPYGGKGAALCYRNRSDVIFVWSMGRE
jgi:hypothetical protein